MSAFGSNAIAFGGENTSSILTTSQINENRMKCIDSVSKRVKKCKHTVKIDSGGASVIGTTG